MTEAEPRGQTEPAQAHPGGGQLRAKDFRQTNEIFPHIPEFCACIDDNCLHCSCGSRYQHLVVILRAPSVVTGGACQISDEWGEDEHALKAPPFIAPTSAECFKKKYD